MTLVVMAFDSGVVYAAGYDGPCCCRNGRQEYVSHPSNCTAACAAYGGWSGGFDQAVCNPSTPPPAQCGYANGNTYSSSPHSSDALCAVGTASGISGTGPWSWTCTSGGSVQNCGSSMCIPYTYSWVQSGFSACSASCGGGTQTQSVYCQRSDGTSVADSYCSTGKPATSQSCNTQACAVVNGQCNNGSLNGCIAGTWSDRTDDANNYLWSCNGAYGGSTDNCALAKPPTYTYAWYQSGFGSCSASCGGGTQSQSVYCLRNDGTTVGDSYCSGSKPGTSQSCNTQACAPTITYAWETGGWSGYGGCTGGTAPTWGFSPSGNYTIFSTGGQKTRTRSVVCRASDGSVAPDSSCSGAKPATSDSPVACATRELIAVAGSGYGSSAWTSARIPGSCTGTILFDGDAPFDNTDGYTPLNLMAQYGGACAINWHTKVTSTSTLTHKFRIYSGKYTTSGTMADINSNLTSWCASYNASRGGGCGFSINGEIPY